MPERAAAEQVLKGLDVHKELALVIVGSASPDGFLPGGVGAEHRLERVRAPFFKRLGRLHVVVAVDEYGLLVLGDEFLSIYHRIAGRFPEAGAVGSGFNQKL